MRVRDRGQTTPWYQIPPTKIKQKILNFEVGLYKDIFQEVDDKDETIETEEELQRLTKDLVPNTSKRSRSQEEDLDQSQRSQRRRQTPHPRGRQQEEGGTQDKPLDQTSSSSSGSDDGEDSPDSDPDPDQPSQHPEDQEMEQDMDMATVEDNFLLNLTPVPIPGDQPMIAYYTPPCINNAARPCSTDHTQSVPETPQVTSTHQGTPPVRKSNQYLHSVDLIPPHKIIKGRLKTPE